MLNNFVSLWLDKIVSVILNQSKWCLPWFHSFDSSVPFQRLGPLLRRPFSIWTAFNETAGTRKPVLFHSRVHLFNHCFFFSKQAESCLGGGRNAGFSVLAEYARQSASGQGYMDILASQQQEEAYVQAQVSYRISVGRNEQASEPSFSAECICHCAEWQKILVEVLSEWQ